MPPNRMPLPSRRGLLAALLLLSPVPLQAQHDHRIWGRVFMEDGEVHEGFIRLTRPRGGAAWTDLLATSREISEEHYQDWLDATRGGKPHVGTIELKGYRITWEQKHPSFERSHRSGIRFGHIAELTIGKGGRIRIVTRSQYTAVAGLEGDSVVVGRDGPQNLDGVRTLADSFDGFTMVRRLNNTSWRIENEGRSVRVQGGDVARIEFAAPPPGPAPPSARLYGTVEDRTGRSFTGFIGWGWYEILESHILDGFWEDVPGLAIPWESDKYSRAIRFSAIRTLERSLCGPTVTLKSGKVVPLCSEPLDRDPRPIRISDPALGLVEVEWDALRIIRFEPPPDQPGYDAFDGGGPLTGTVVTREGEEIEGRIRWDADEDWSWETLQGSSEDVEFSIEFGKITHIAREESGGALVTLRDGRSFHLTGGNDVDRDNRGIFIFPAAAEGAAAAAVGDPATGAAVADVAAVATAGKPAPGWRYVAWEDFREVRFRAVEAEEPGS